MASLVMGDSMIIYCLWVVWGFIYYVIIFPLLTLAGLTAVSVLRTKSRNIAASELKVSIHRDRHTKSKFRRPLIYAARKCQLPRC
ncbi:hypothetical protein ARMSODRAFT_151496 [Armillaria solidipes]|uniref:Uncharacterized protein n=1 Tax=Armillaria solidipes TaxID=1076256 RepID=A0A2H3BZ83_9AGAR|nr:hypothetical protein ARMSODRAFT_151496 [Armillaria solidipes]